MNSAKYALFTGLVLAVTNAQALVNVYNKSANASRMLLTEKASAAAQESSNQRIYLAGKPRSSEKTTTRTTKDGDTVTTEITRTNDGQGNKTKIKSKTTTHPSSDTDSNSGSGSSSGGAGASYEGL
jgi:hypothetical protein